MGGLISSWWFDMILQYDALFYGVYMNSGNDWDNFFLVEISINQGGVF